MSVERIGVVVVTHNSERHVPELLDSLPAALDGMPAQVVVVDNGSTDRTCEVVSHRNDCRLVESTNGGYSRGINQGMDATPGVDAWFIVNPDLVCQAGSIRALAAALASSPDIGIVGPRVVSPEGALQPSMRRAPTLGRNTGLSFTGWAPLSEYVDAPSAYDSDRDAEWLLGAALMVSAACRASVGPWDESYFLYAEETDFCLRAHDLGWRVRYVADATVVHEGGGSGRSSTTHAMQIVNRVRLYRRRHGLAASALYYGLTVASEVTWWARGAVVSRASLTALLRPSRRPAELAASEHLIPR